MEYFKLYLSPDRGRLIAAPSQRCGGGAGRELAATLLPAGPRGRSRAAGPGPPAMRLPRAGRTARGARRGVKVAGAAGGARPGVRGPTGVGAGGQSLTHA